MAVRMLKTYILLLIVLSCNSFAFAIDVDIDAISSHLPPEFANSNFTLDDVKTILKDKCHNVAGAEAGDAAYTDIENGGRELIECISGIVNTTAIQAEIDAARPIGELDAVFNKHCLKRPEALDCVQNFTRKMETCLDEEERKHSDVFMRIVTSLLNFVCHKGGDQIALFVAEKGPECLQSNVDNIRDCINNTFSEYIPKSGVPKVETVSQFIIGPKQCQEMQRLENCIVTALEKCDEITPANIVESMFRFIKNETTCRTDSTSARHKSSDSSHSASAPFAMLLGLISTIIFLTKLI